MRSWREKAALAGLVLLQACVQPMCCKQDSSGQVVERVLMAMGTALRLEVAAGSRASGLQASEAAVLTIERAEQRLSSWRDDSELARLNRLPVAKWQAASGALLRDLATARRWSRATDRAFDPGVGALLDAYDLRGEGRWPCDGEVEVALANCGIDKLRVLRDVVTRDVAGLRLDAGAFGKGAALDAAASAMLASGATSGLLDFGGQLLLVGSRDACSFAVADPDVRDRRVLSVQVDHGSLATTGNSERRLRVDGREFGHLLDPRTGRPAADFGSVTVWAPDAFAADCLSTALFVMGPDEALAWVERHAGIEAIVVQRHQHQFTARVTSGLRKRVEALTPDLTIQ